MHGKDLTGSGIARHPHDVRQPLRSGLKLLSSARRKASSVTQSAISDGSDRYVSIWAAERTAPLCTHDASFGCSETVNGYLVHWFIMFALSALVPIRRA